jgi:hypothetical protein
LKFKSLGEYNFRSAISIELLTERTPLLNKLKGEYYIKTRDIGMHISKNAVTVASSDNKPNLNGIPNIDLHPNCTRLRLHLFRNNHTMITKIGINSSVINKQSPLVGLPDSQSLF